MRQGNDVGTQYRSAISTAPTPQRAAARALARRVLRARCASAGYGEITTEIAPRGEFYYAEDYHQQYLAQEPQRLLRPRRHRRDLPGRARRRRRVRPSHRAIVALEGGGLLGAEELSGARKVLQAAALTYIAALAASIGQLIYFFIASRR